MLPLESERSGCANDDFGRCLRPFHVLNALRLVCYLRQIYKIVRDTTGAGATSYPVWILRIAANSSTAIYSLTNPGDITPACQASSHLNFSRSSNCRLRKTPPDTVIVRRQAPVRR